MSDSKIVVVSLVYNSNCMMFIQTNPLRLVNKLEPLVITNNNDYQDNLSKGISGLTIFKSFCWFVSGRNAGADIICSRLEKDLQNGICKVVPTRAIIDIGNNLHDVMCFKVNERIASLLAVSSYWDQIVKIDYNMHDHSVSDSIWLDLHQPGHHDVHHINCLCQHDGNVYITAAHKNDEYRTKNESDVIQVSLSFDNNPKRVQWMELVDSQNKPYTWAHNFIKLDDGYIINNSAKGYVVRYKNGKHVEKYLGGWVRGLLHIPEERVWLVGVSSFKTGSPYNQKNDSVNQSTIMAVDDETFDVVDSLKLPAPAAACIYDLKEWSCVF